MPRTDRRQSAEWVRRVRRSAPEPAGGWKRRNTLNELSPREWLRFQKSWFIHNPPPRPRNVMLHPAKFPESLVGEFIRFFTKAGEKVLDPMLGTGSTLIAAWETGRQGIGVELLPKYADIAVQRLEQAIAQPELPTGERELELEFRVITGDSRHLGHYGLCDVDYCITSPPYWDMLRMKGFETQSARRKAGLDVAYSDDERDLGNIDDYGVFLEELVDVYKAVRDVMRPGAYVTIIVKNVKKGGTIYPLGWELALRLRDVFALKDERIWCQDDQRLAPYGMGTAWVSNTFHHYCLNFRNET